MGGPDYISSLQVFPGSHLPGSLPVDGGYRTKIIVKGQDNPVARCEGRILLQQEASEAGMQLIS